MTNAASLYSRTFSQHVYDERAPRDAGGFSFALSTCQALDQGRRAPIAHKAHGAPAALLLPLAGSKDPFPPPPYLEQRRAHEAA